MLEILLGSVALALAVSAATADLASMRPFPGLLDWIRRYPWPAVGVFLTALLTVSVWPQCQLGAPLAAADDDGGAAAAAEQPRLRRELLAEVCRIWLDGVLARSLGQVVRVELHLSDRPDLVAPIWGALTHEPGQPTRSRSTSVPIAEVADRLGWRLLVLGQPGTGKSTLLLQLAEALHQRALQDAGQPIPVVFHLSAWPSTLPPLAAWLVDELRYRYGVPRHLARHLVARDQMAVLLDGLDEVPAEDRRACAEAINAFRREHGAVPLVVCARTQDYQDLAMQLQLGGAIEAQPLDREQVRHWLQDAGTPLAGLRQALEDPDHPLWVLLTTPLLLSIAALAYQDRPAHQIQDHGSIAVLFDRYVARMLARPRAPLAETQRGLQNFSAAETMRWLGWLARWTPPAAVFDPDRLQTIWLPRNRQQWLVTAGPPLLIGMLFGPAIGLAIGWGFGRDWGVATAQVLTFFGLLVPAVLALGHLRVYLAERRGRSELATRLRSRIQQRLSPAPVERLRWAPTPFPGEHLVGLAFILAFGWWGVGRFPLSEFRAAVLLLAGVGTALELLLLSHFLLAPQLSLEPVAPGAGMRATTRTALTIGLLSGLAGCVFYAVMGWLAGIGLAAAPAAGLFFAVINWAYYGGGDWLSYRLLAWQLARSGLLPADLLTFLREADSRVLLRRAGGGYLFVHRLLQEHLAGQRHHIPSVTQPTPRRDDA